MGQCFTEIGKAGIATLGSVRTTIGGTAQYQGWHFLNRCGAKQHRINSDVDRIAGAGGVPLFLAVDVDQQQLVDAGQGRHDGTGSPHKPPKGDLDRFRLPRGILNIASQYFKWHAHGEAER